MSVGRFPCQQRKGTTEESICLHTLLSFFYGQNSDKTSSDDVGNSLRCGKSRKQSKTSSVEPNIGSHAHHGCHPDCLASGHLDRNNTYKNNTPPTALQRSWAQTVNRQSRMSYRGRDNVIPEVCKNKHHLQPPVILLGTP